MRKDHGVLCMSEVELGLPLPPGMNAVVQGKTGNSREFRDLVLMAKKYNGE